MLFLLNEISVQMAQSVKSLCASELEGTLQ